MMRWSARPWPGGAALRPRQLPLVLSHRARRMSTVPAQPHASLAAAAAPTLPVEGVEGPGGTRTFWAHAVARANPADLKRQHASARAADKSSRFAVRGRLREDGAHSNLFPLRFDPAAQPLYVYELYVTRHAAPTAAAVAPPPAKKGRRKRGAAASGQETAPGGERRVPPGRAWVTVQRWLERSVGAALPPVVQLEHRVYAAAPLPAEALTVPPELRDLGWAACELRLEGRVALADMPAARLQELANKMIVWAMRSGNAAAGGFDVVKPSTGKLVSTRGGVTAGGLRVFKGTQATAIFVDESGQAAPAADARGGASGLVPPLPVLTSRDLGEAAQGIVATPMRFVVAEVMKSFTYKGKKVESYKIADASGAHLVSVWEPATPHSLQRGRIYTVTGARLRIFPERNNMRLFEFLAEGTTWAEDAAAPELLAAKPSAAATDAREEKEGGDGAAGGAHLPGQLAVKIDTKGTIASESSLWDDVRQHFGAGAGAFGDEETRERVRRSLEGTPCVVSHSMAQGLVREVRFPATAEELAEAVAPRHTDPRLRRHLPFVDPGQPYARLSNGLVYPLQMLHCCFDPRMRGWADISIAVLSIMPRQRMQVLEAFRAALASGLRAWGLCLAARPWHTRTLSVLPVPHKDARPPPAPAQLAALRHPPPHPYPTTVVVVGVAAARATEEDRRRVSLTTQRLAQYFKTPSVTVVAEEAAAVRYVVDTAVVPGDGAAAAAGGGGGAGRLRDPNTALILVTPDRTTRASRWVLAEALSRGIVPVALPPTGSPANAARLCAAAKRQLLGKFECNPLRGVDLAREVPSLAGRRVLVVGVDSCHTSSVSTGAVVGILAAPERNHLLPVFWRHEARGREVQHVTRHFSRVLADAAALYDGLDEVVLFQDGDVASELAGTKAELAALLPGCGFTFLCLHKRSNIRFVHGAADAPAGTHNNLVKGVVIPALAPVLAAGAPGDGGAADAAPATAAFYMQTHESPMSTARIVQYSVHHSSPTLSLPDVQAMANVMANVLAPAATKLPMTTRCAHKLADLSERLLDAVPQLESDMIPPAVRQRLWFL